jgi:hypothetical protein
LSKRFKPKRNRAKKVKKGNSKIKDVTKNLSDNLTKSSTQAALETFFRDLGDTASYQIADAIEEALLEQIINQNDYPALAQSITHRKNGQIVTGSRRDLVDSGELGESVNVSSEGETVSVSVEVDFADALEDHIGFFSEALARARIDKIMKDLSNQI